MPFKKCITKINNNQVDNAEGVHVVLLMQKLSKYSKDYLKTSGSLYQYCSDEPALDNIGGTVYFTNDKTTNLFKFTEKITDQTDNNGTKSVEIMVPLKHVSNFSRTPLEMLLIIYQVNVILNWYKGCLISSNALAAQATFPIIDIKIFVPVVTLSTHIQSCLNN